MTTYKQIFNEWKRLLSEENEVESLRILDFDETIAWTGESVFIRDADGNIAEELDSSEFKDHDLTPEQIDLGYYYDFSEFDDVDIEKAVANNYVTSILRNFISADNPEKRIILILTARSQEAESGIRNLLGYLGLESPNIDIVGVGTSRAEKKVDKVREYLELNPQIERVSFFDDSGENVYAMASFLQDYKNVRPGLKYDVAVVNEDGTLTRIKEEGIIL
jgi:hypothetical protein